MKRLGFGDLFAALMAKHVTVEEEIGVFHTDFHDADNGDDDEKEDEVDIDYQDDDDDDDDDE